MRAHGTRNSNVVIKIHELNIFTRSTTLPAVAKFFVTRMLTRDLFAVANLLVILTIAPFVDERSMKLESASDMSKRNTDNKINFFNRCF